MQITVRNKKSNLDLGSRKLTQNLAWKSGSLMQDELRVNNVVYSQMDKPTVDKELIQILV